MSNNNGAITAGRRSYRLNGNSIKRISENLQHYEGQPRNEVPQGMQPSNFGGAVMVHTTTSISRMSSATPGTGSGKLQALVSGSYTDLSTTVITIVNDTVSLIASGSYVMCVPAYGKYHVLNINSCSNLS